MKYLQTTPTATNTMKLRLAIVAFLFFAFVFNGNAQSIWTNPINGTDPGSISPYTTGQTSDANITVSGIVRGPGLLANTANNRYNARSWSTTGIDLNDYFEFTLDANAGYRIDFASMQYTGQKSSQGPANFALRSSLDGYTSNIGTAGTGATTISLSAAAYQGLTAPITFRLYGWGAIAATGTFSVNDFTFNANVNAVCASVAITSVYPTSGPVGTQVTISAASGLAGATASFGGVAATVVSSSATTLVVNIPTGAASGNLIVRNAANCASLPVAYTIITSDNSTCEGNSSFSDLIISEIFDETSGSGGAIELFNPTGAAINMTVADYRLARFTDSAAPVTVLDLMGTIPSGSTYLISAVAATAACAGLTYSEILPTGFNANDRFELRKNNTTAIDVAYGGTAVGYNAYRNVNAVGPTTIYNAADWNIVLAPDCSDLGYFPPIAKVPPTPTVPVLSAITCTGTSANISVTATEGHTGGLGLAYQWYVVAPGAPGTWSALTNAGVYTGTTTATLNISNVAGLNDYQYYCRILENAVTCYAASNAVILKEAATTWTSTGWNNGTPSLTKRAIIDFTYNTGTNGSFDACSLTVNAARTLTISPNTYVTVQNEIVTTGALLEVEDDGSLVQNNNASVNTGNITAKREVTIRKYDYVYWSSPVAGFPVTSVSTGTAANFIYKWLPTTGGNAYGIWTNANENMALGKGYIVRGPSAFPTTPQLFATAFTGIANNGTINATIQRGGYQGIPYDNGNSIFVTNNDDNWNLVGNPYPSAINALQFLTANANIEGAVRLWTHGSLPASATTDPFYGNFLYNYNSNDYIVHNGTMTLSGPAGFTGNIASGQGFFVLMDDGTAATQSVVFNNGMRSSTYGNTQFYRPTNSEANEREGESGKSRIWLDLIGTDTTVSRTGIGYVEGATVNKDRLYDAYGKLDNNQNFYSLINSEVMTIQGRPLPFDDTDMVPLGVHLTAAGNYKIAIAATDGLFLENTHDIFLEDKALQIIHDLKQAPYNFTAEAGILDTRFVLRYTNQSLGNSRFNALDNQVFVAIAPEQISIKSNVEPIQTVTLYDLLGRQIAVRNEVNANEIILHDIAPKQQAMVVKILLENGQTVTRKILF